MWPSYRHVIYYDWGPWYDFGYVYPRYHRKYIFVGIGGYWPSHYSYARYYWYGYQPWHWYGRNPDIYESKSDTYNYYTYNYTDDQPEATVYGSADSITPVDEDTFADVRERMAQEKLQAEQTEPASETEADRLFEAGVTAFEDDDYKLAADRFARVASRDEDDVVLPFAYAQALFADEQYSKAVKVLRSAIENVPSEKQGILFPRGLYSDDAVLTEQIDTLKEQVQRRSFDSDLQLLLGYQLLGVEKYDEASIYLKQVRGNFANGPSAEKLLALIEKIEE